MKNIGIDIGGTSIKGAVIENGTVTARAKPRPTYPADSTASGIVFSPL